MGGEEGHGHEGCVGGEAEKYKGETEDSASQSVIPDSKQRAEYLHLECWNSKRDSRTLPPLHFPVGQSQVS